MKIIFLDIDGVINTNDTLEKGITVDPERVSVVRHICDMTGAKIVLSSSWRANPQLVEGLKGLGLQIIDTTIIAPRDMMLRGQEIQLWLNSHAVEKYAIIDDDIDMLRTQTHNFFHLRIATRS